MGYRRYRHGAVQTADPDDVGVSRALRGLCSVCGGEPHGAEHEAAIDRYRRVWKKYRIKDAQDRLDEGTPYTERLPVLPDTWARSKDVTCDQCAGSMTVKVMYEIVKSADGPCDVHVRVHSYFSTCFACRADRYAAAHRTVAEELHRKAEEWRRRRIARGKR